MIFLQYAKIKTKKLITTGLTNLDSITVKRNPTVVDNELANKKKIDDELNKNTIHKVNQTLDNHLRVSVGDDLYSLKI